MTVTCPSEFPFAFHTVILRVELLGHRTRLICKVRASYSIAIGHCLAFELPYSTRTPKRSYWNIFNGIDMKPQVMTISTTILHEEQHNGEIPTKSAKLDILHVKQEPDDISETESTSPPDAQGPRHSHHRKKMMEKWMNVNDGNGVARKHLSTRNHDNVDARRSSKSPSKSPSSPLPIMSHVPADPRKWAALHVGRWLEAVAAKYALQVNKTDFVMNGRALCLMKREGFLDRVPENGAILFEDFRRRLRQYLTACRQRVRTTYATQGNISLPGRVPHFPTPAAVSGTPQMPNSPLVQPNAASPWIAPFSALRNQLGIDRKPAGVLGVPTGLHTAQPPQGPLPFLQAAPFGLGNTPLVHGSSSHSNTQGVRQSSSRNDPTFLPPSQAGPSASTSALVTAINGQYFAAASHIVGASSLHPSLPGQPSSAANTVQPCPLHSAPSTLHPAQSSQHPTLPTSFTTTAPHTVTTHVAPTQSASVSTSCAVHSSSPAPDPHSSPYPYLGGKCQLHPSPYYKFVPIYRTMRVVGQFQPIPYGYPRSLPPATLPTAPSEFSSRSQPGRIASPTLTLQASDQSQALDLSTSNNTSTRPPSADQHVPSTNDRKRMKTQPL